MLFYQKKTLLLPLLICVFAGLVAWSGQAFAEGEKTLDISLDNSSYGNTDKVRVTVNVGGFMSEQVDVYVACILPSGDFSVYEQGDTVTLNQTPNLVAKFLGNIIVPDGSYNLELPLDGTWENGNYEIYVILTKAGGTPLSQANWVGYASKPFAIVLDPNAGSDNGQQEEVDLGNNVILKLAKISGGEFVMGSPDSDPNGQPDEKPQHTVRISEFHMGICEVTNAQFCEFLNASSDYSQYYVSTMMIVKSANGLYTSVNDKESYPVTYVSYLAAQDFCKWLTTKTGQAYRLPTEAEWEYAYRAGSTTLYYTGDDIDSTKANFEDSVGGLSRVGSYSANAYGLYDMAGNAVEWCSDWFGLYASTTATDPQGASAGLARVTRGGGYKDPKANLRSANREYDSPTSNSNPSYGFRVVRAVGTGGSGEETSVDLGNSISLTITKIKAGSFMMGSPDSDTDANSDEKPQHEVAISKDYYIGKYEITNAQYCAFLNDGNSDHYNQSMYITSAEGVYTPMTDKENYPVVQVTWDDAVAFCAWLSTKTGKSFSLPTEAQWEYACRANTTTKYYWGDTFDKTMLNAGSSATSVGTYPSNPWRLYDMYSNVAEMCSDWYDDSYYSSAFFKLTDPTGPSSGTYRVVRGGSYDYNYYYYYYYNSDNFSGAKVRSAYRSSFTPSQGKSYVGFRVVRND